MKHDTTERDETGALHNCEGCGARYDTEIADDECPVCDRPRTIPEVDWEIVPYSNKVRIVEGAAGPRIEVGEGVLDA